MEALGAYQIDLRNLSGDSHEYTYSLGDAFFAELSASEIQKGSLNVSLKLKKIQKSFNLYFHIEGFVFVQCDRCLQDLRLDVAIDEEVNVRLGAIPSEGDEVVVVSEKDGILDVAWLIYEFIMLHLPMVRMHAEGECDKEMIKALHKHQPVVDDDIEYPERKQPREHSHCKDKELFDKRR